MPTRLTGDSAGLRNGSTSKLDCHVKERPRVELHVAYLLIDNKRKRRRHLPNWNPTSTAPPLTAEPTLAGRSPVATMLAITVTGPATVSTSHSAHRHCVQRPSSLAGFRRWHTFLAATPASSSSMTCWKNCLPQRHTSSSSDILISGRPMIAFSLFFFTVRISPVSCFA